MCLRRADCDRDYPRKGASGREQSNEGTLSPPPGTEMWLDGKWLEEVGEQVRSQVGEQV